MKHLFALLTALCLMLTACPAPAEAPEAAPDMAQLYLAAPITLADYVALYTSAMVAYVDPAYGERAVWHLELLPDGSVVLTDGLHSNGTYILALTVEGPYVKSIRVSRPYDDANVEENTSMFFSWCVMAATPIPMRDGVPFTEAINIAHAGLADLMNAVDAPETYSVCGMQAEPGRTSGPDSTITMTYTFHREPESLPRPSGDDLTAVSAQAYMQAMDAYYLTQMGEPFVWTNPEEWLGGTLIAGDCLSDIPALMIVDEQLAMMMISMPRYENNGSADYETIRGLARLCCLPILTAGGMTAGEAETAWALWVEESHFPALLASALNGSPCITWFYGFPMQIDADGERINLTLYTPLTGQLILPEEAEEPTAPLTAEAYIAAVDRLAANYDGALQWAESPMQDGMSAWICETLGGNPCVLAAADGSLIAVACATPIDSAQLQASFDEFMGSVTTLMGAVLCSDGMAYESVMAELTPVLNEEVVPAVISILTQGGEPVNFVFCGYGLRLEMTDAGGQSILSLTLAAEPESFFGPEVFPAP